MLTQDERTRPTHTSHAPYVPRASRASHSSRSTWYDEESRYSSTNASTIPATRETGQTGRATSGTHTGTQTDTHDTQRYATGRGDGRDSMGNKERQSKRHPAEHSDLAPSISRWYERGIEMLSGGWIRLLACIGLITATGLLYVLSGGFPPWAWRFLAQVLPQFPALVNAQGASAVLALAGLLLLSCSLLVLWIIAVYCWVLLLHANLRAFVQWRGRRLREHDAEILAEAHMARLYEQEIQQQEQEALEEEQRREREEWEQMAQFRARASGVTPAVRPQTQSGRQEQQGQQRTQHVQRGQDQHNLFDEREEDPESLDGLDTLPFPDNDTQPLQVDTPQQIVSYAVSAGSDPGKTRKNAPNEDSHFAMQGTYQTPSGPHPVGLFIVADGMGGHANGREASRLAVQTLGDILLPLLMNTEQDVQDPEMFLETLKDGVHRANLAIYQRNRERERMMGTTITAALVVGTTAHVVNVGDSRTYVYRASDGNNGTQGLIQVTRDHSSVARLVEAGAIAPEDIYTHPLRNQIYRCLGDSASIQVDTFEVPLEANDTLLLCSDGLWEMVHDADIEEILSRTHTRPALARDELIQAALDGGGADNVSVVVVTRM